MLRITLSTSLAMSYLLLTACSGNSSTYSILPAAQTFKEAASSTNSKVDVLFVVDNSNSMASSQTNLTTYFPSFISSFASKNLDFQMAVTTTDAYLSEPLFASFYTDYPFLYDAGQTQAHKAKFRDGLTTEDGVFIMLPTTPSLASIFLNNATVGVNGYGDERPWQSMIDTLNSPLNSGFVRSNSFLSIISMSDEDDFSWNGTAYLDNDYTDPRLYQVSDMLTYLNGLTSSTTANKKYSWNSISIQDQTCLATLNASVPGRTLGPRNDSMATATGGAILSLCSDFATGLESIAENILELATQFPLTRTPIVSSIVVTVDGATVVASATNGWRYDSTKNSIIFSGTAIPENGAIISVAFQPTGLTF
jgi:hypothetical protein